MKATAIKKFLRKKGYFTEGYDADRDSWLERMKLPFGLEIVRPTKNFADPGVWRIPPSGKASKRPPKFKLMRKGMKPMYFGSASDMLARIKDVFSREGYDSSPDLPFIIHNQHNGKYTLYHPHRIEALRGVSYRGADRVVGPAMLPFPG